MINVDKKLIVRKKIIKISSNKFKLSYTTWLNVSFNFKRILRSFSVYIHAFNNNQREKKFEHYYGMERVHYIFFCNG